MRVCIRPRLRCAPVKEVQDHWFKLAKEEGYRSRAAYKLIGIEERKRVLRRGMRVLDAGAAPGSWSQVAADRVGHQGVVFAVDITPIDPGLPENVHRVHADLREITLDDIGGERFDAVLSDMAPKTTGDPMGDHFQSVRLCDDLLDQMPQWLHRGGNMVIKVFEGRDYPDLLKRAARMFDDARGYKPRASRAESVEMFIICFRFNGKDGRIPHQSDAILPKRKPSAGWGADTQS